MNSIPSMPASIMRLTALPPPPPTPMTLILASLRFSSLKEMRMSVSSFFIYVRLVRFAYWYCLCPFREQRNQLRTPTIVLEPTCDARSVSIEDQPNYGGELRLCQRGGHLRQGRRPGETHWLAQHGVRNIQRSRHPRSSAAQHEPCDANLQHARVTKVVPHQ